MNPRETAPVLPLARMARRLGVPQHWLRQQADAGVVPCLKVGKSRYVFNVAAATKAVADLAAIAKQEKVLQ